MSRAASPPMATRRARLFVLSAGSQQWRELAPMHHARGALALLAIDGRLYAIGGRDHSVADRGRSRPTTPRRGQWRDLAVMPQPRNHVAGYVDGALAVRRGRPHSRHERGGRLLRSRNLSVVACARPCRRRPRARRPRCSTVSRSSRAENPRRRPIWSASSRSGERELGARCPCSCPATAPRSPSIGGGCSPAEVPPRPASTPSRRAPPWGRSPTRNSLTCSQTAA